MTDLSKYIHITPSTASPELQKRLEGVKDLKAEHLTGSSTALHVMRMYQEAVKIGDFVRTQIGENPMPFSDDQILSISEAFGKRIEAYLNYLEAKHPSNSVLPMHHVVPLVPEVGWSPYDGLREGGFTLIFWRVDFSSLVLLTANLYHKEKEGHETDPDALTSARAGKMLARMVNKVLGIIDEYNFPILTLKGREEKIGLRDFATIERSSEPGPIKIEKTCRNYKFIFNEVRKCDVPTISFTVNRLLYDTDEIYARAKSELTLNTLEVQRKLAIGFINRLPPFLVVGFEKNSHINGRELVDLSLRHLNEYLRRFERRLNELKQQDMPSSLIDHELSSIERISYSIKIIKQHRPWLISFLSR